MSYHERQRGAAPPYPMAGRDYGREGGGYGQGGGFHGGSGRGGRGGHGGGRGRRGGRGGGREPDVVLPLSLEVKTNLFKVSYTGRPLDVWHMYQIELRQKKMFTAKDQENNTNPLDMPEINAEKIDRQNKKLQERGSTDLTRKLCQKLSEDVYADTGIPLATDSAQIGLSPQPLWDFTASNSCEKYLVTIDGRFYHQMRLIYTGDISLGVLSRRPERQEELDTVNKIKQSIEILIKHGLSLTCLAVGKNPDTFFLPEFLQKRLLGNGPLSEYYARPGSFAPYVGLSQSARFSNSGALLLAVNNKVDWLYRDSEGSPGNTTEAGIPILNSDQGIIAGIRIGNLHSKITNPDLRARIERELARLTFAIKFRKGPAWAEEKCEKKGEDYVNANISVFNRQKRMAPTKEERKAREDGAQPSPLIKWGCDEEIFKPKWSEEEMNVATYYSRAYDIEIKYPNMPLVSTLKGWFPIEFLYQEIARVGGNETEKVQKVLSYYDAFAGTARINHVEEVMKLALEEGREQSLLSLFERFSLSVNPSRPLSAKATRLPSPRLQFGNTIEALEEGSNQGKGSWNLRDREFHSPAELPSFAIVDFCQQGRGLPVNRLMPALFDAFRRHGVKVRNSGENKVASLVAPGCRRGDIGGIIDSLKEAKERAKDVFLRSKFFYTCVVGPDGHIENTWVVKDDRGEWHRIPPFPEPSHMITNRGNGNTAFARIQFQRSDGAWVDPSEVKDDVALTGNIGAFRVEGYPAVIQENDISATKFYFKVEEWQIECPAMIFCYLPDDDKSFYDCVKTMGDLELGVATQCIVQETATKQKTLNQYCSNIALKVNTKLFNKGNAACAWKLAGGSVVVERSTMIMGYSLAHGRIHGGSATAVAGSVCLLQPMQMGQVVQFQKRGQKSDVVAASVLRELVQDLAMNFFANTDNPPEEIIVYRDGGSAGSFESIKNEEAEVIRQSIRELNEEAGKSSPNPPITFIIANNDHNMRIVPANPRGEGIKGNVPSGTIVGDIVEDFRLDNSFSFLLTSQGPLKGTSKPILYRCIVNETQRFDKEYIEKLTYALSFQYGSATKSPRKIPVVLNSEKLANRAISYGAYLGLAKKVDLFVEEDEEQFKRRDATGEALGGRLFESFGVFDKRVSLGPIPTRIGYRAPFRPHITG